MSENITTQADASVKPRRGDPWYKHYPRDYIDGTRHLSLEERGAYSDIIDLLYIHNGSIPDDEKWVGFALHVSTRKWRSLRAALIRHGKIVVEAGVITNARVTFEVGLRLVQSRVNADTALNRERTKRENLEKRNEINESAARKEHHTRVRVRKADTEKIESPDGDSSPGVKNPDLLAPVEAAKPDVLQQAVEVWNEAAAKAGLPKVRILSEARRKKLAARLKEAGGIDGWREAIGKLVASDFLTGKVKDWKADFGFVLQQESFARLVEGGYDNRRNMPRANRLPPQPVVERPFQPSPEYMAELMEARRIADEIDRNRPSHPTVPPLTTRDRINQH